MARIYIAGPYSSDPENNTNAAIDVAEKLAAMGHTPYIPHLTHYWHARHPHDYEFWMLQDLAWLKQCNAVLRLPGESAGADREVQWAIEFHTPVYYSINELIVKELGF
jgi:hypothetical protein